MKFVALALLALSVAGCSRDPLVAPQTQSTWVQQDDPNGVSLVLSPDGTARLQNVDLVITCSDQTYQFSADFVGSWSTGVFSTSTIVSGYLIAEDLPDALGPVAGKFVAQYTANGGFEGSAQALTNIGCLDGHAGRDETSHFSLIPLTD